MTTFKDGAEEFDPEDGDDIQPPNIEAEDLLLRHFANQAESLFDSFLVIASNNKDSRTLYYMIHRGNKFATKHLASQYVRGAIGGDEPGLAGVTVN